MPWGGDVRRLLVGRRGGAGREKSSRWSALYRAFNGLTSTTSWAKEALWMRFTADRSTVCRVEYTSAHQLSREELYELVWSAPVKQAAAKFGWSQRNPKPGSMRDGDWLIGWGCATSTYPSNIGPAAVRISVTPAGKATIQLAAHEIGTGAYTVVAITAAHSLGLKVEDMTVMLGDSNMPPGKT